MSDSSDQWVPVLTPPVAFLGKEQRIVIECAAKFPDKNVTVDLLDKGERRGLLNRQTATVLGPRTCRIELPVVDSEGDYLLVLRFNSLQDKRFPGIPLRVLSPLESIQHCIPVSSEHIEKAPVLAAVVAYLIQAGRVGRKERIVVGDELLCEILQSMYARKLPIMSVPAFLCDRYYGGHETLLHFALRLRLEKTSFFMLEDDIVTNYKGLLDLQGYDKKLPLEIARERGLSEVRDRIVTLSTVQNRSGQDRTSSEESDLWEQPQRRKHSAEREKNQENSSSDESSTARSRLRFLAKTRLGQVCKTTLEGARQVMSRSYSQPAKMTASASQETFKVQAVRREHSVENPSLEDRRLLGQKSVDELKEDCMYTKMIITDYVALNETNNLTQLQIGDIAHVVEEFKMCKGVVNNVYCQFPSVILSPLWEDKRPQQMQENGQVDEDDKGYAAIGYHLPHVEDGVSEQGDPSPAYTALVRDTVTIDDDYQDLDVTTMCMLQRPMATDNDPHHNWK